jgi:hypothetical protein
MEVYMPLFQAMAERANHAFNRYNIGKVDASALKAGSFGEAAGTLGIAESGPERAFLDTFPLAIQEAVTAVLRSALQRSPRLPVTFAWAPGYEFELLISEARTVDGSLGGITVFVRTRYPHDPLR